MERFIQTEIFWKKKVILSEHFKGTDTLQRVIILTLQETLYCLLSNFRLSDYNGGLHLQTQN